MLRAVGRILRCVVGAGLLAICLPVWLLAIPVCVAIEAIQQRRSVRLGQEVTHWRAPDVCLDLIVVDISRVDQGLVGVRKRYVNLLHLSRTGEPLPPYGESVEFIEMARLRVPEPFLRRGWWRVERTVCATNEGVPPASAGGSDRR